ncbi:MAG TPA: sensor histidine kinase [Bacillales bacterium]|nr:sensor histidine kinase [Bacillales bacterium]
MDSILANMVETVVGSKKQIYEVGETSREECDKVLKDLEIVRYEAADKIKECESLATEAGESKLRFAAITKHYRRHTLAEFRNLQEQVQEVQEKLTKARKAELKLKEKRDHLEQKAVSLQEKIERAEAIIGQVSVVLNYLNGDLRQIGEMVEDAQNKQALGLKIIEAQEEERRRLSREIHDGPAQTLARVLLTSELVEHIQKNKGSEAANEEFEHLREMIRQALTDVRRIIYDLRPMTLDDLGLIPTLDKYLRRMEEQENIPITLEKKGSLFRLSPKMEAALFRLIQEAVQNACKHAEANAIHVKIQFDQNMILMVIKDDGKGFSPRDEKKGTFGFVGMRERVELLEGEFSVLSESGIGTVIVFQIPVHNQGDAT